MDAKINAMQVQPKNQGQPGQPQNEPSQQELDPNLDAQAALFKQLLQGGQAAASGGVNVSTNPAMDLSQYLSAGIAANPSVLTNLDAATLQELLSGLQNQPGMEAIIQELNQALSKKGQLSGGDDPTQTATNAVLQGMIPQTLQGIEVKPTATPVSPESRIASMVDTVAQSIMVSNPELSSSKQQVLIVLKPDVLPGAQVMVSRGDTGLQVVFQASVLDSANFLSQNQASLQNFLAGRLSEPVQVTVQQVSSTAQGSQPENNEGRSKGQYIPEPEDPAQTS